MEKSRVPGLMRRVSDCSDLINSSASSGGCGGGCGPAEAEQLEVEQVKMTPLLLRHVVRLSRGSAHLVRKMSARPTHIEKLNDGGLWLGCWQHVS